jgi:hypothetical protein
VIECGMSSAETPPDPNEPEPTYEESLVAAKHWLLLVGVLAVMAVAVKFL